MRKEYRQIGQSNIIGEGLNLPWMALKVKEVVHELMKVHSLEKFGKTRTWSLPRAYRKEHSLDTVILTQ